MRRKFFVSLIISFFGLGTIPAWAAPAGAEVEPAQQVVRRNIPRGRRLPGYSVFSISLDKLPDGMGGIAVREVEADTTAPLPPTATPSPMNHSSDPGNPAA